MDDLLLKNTYVLMILLFFLTGSVFGSFLNVVIFRIPKKESLSYPSSHCMYCGHSLRVLDLIPVFSWLCLKGRCRYCKRPISIQYPLIEFISACLFVFFYLSFGLSIETLAFCVITLFCIPLFVIDMRHCILPNKILIFFAAAAVCLSIIHIREPLFLYASTDPLEPLKGAMIGGGILLLISILGYYLYGKREVMGMGDVKLLIVIGLLCGFKNTLLILAVSSVLAALIGIALFAAGKKSRTDKLAFGPFIIVAFYIVLLLPMLKGGSL